jgi:hypothetical protein
MKILNYKFLVDEMTDDEIAEEEAFLLKHEWTPKNAGLDFKTFIKSINPIYAPIINSTAMFKVMGGAKGLGKSSFALQYMLYSLFNFKDVNTEFWKYAEKHAYQLVSEKIFKFTKIFDNNGSSISKVIASKDISVSNAPSNSNFKITWPNNRTFNIFGYDNKESWAGNDDKTTGAIFTTYFDEILPQDIASNPILDDQVWLKDFIAWMSQKMRPDGISLFDRELKMLTAFVEFEYDNEFGETIRRTEKICYKKTPSLLFGFNQHDTAASPHPIRSIILDGIVTDLEILKKEGIQIIEDKDYAKGLGRIVFIGTTIINKENMSDNLFKLGAHVKKTNPDLYASIFLGNNMEYSTERYVYRRDLINREKLFEDYSNVGFDEIIFGGDYADSVRGKDDTAIIMIGIKHKERSVSKVVILDELTIHSRQVRNQSEKLKLMGQWILDHWENLLHKYPHWYLSKRPLVRFGHDSRTVVHVIQEYIYQHSENRFLVGTVDNEFSTFQGNKWRIAERENLLRKLISDEILWFDSSQIKDSLESSMLYNDLNSCIKDPKKDMRDEKPGVNRLDTINALEYGLSLFRNWMI